MINISITKKAVLSLATLVSFCLIFAVSCNNGQAPSGALPTWKIGDTWTTRASLNGQDYCTNVDTMIGEQVFNGIDCYTVTTQISTQGTSTTTEVTSTKTAAVDKTTLDTIGFEASGSMNGTAYTETGNKSYNYSVKPYPLSVGKTWTVTITTASTSFTTGQNQTIPETYRYTYKVEKVESITVPAGTFQCFKIVQYDSSNSIVNTRWVTDVTGVSAVKEIYSVGVTSELASYSLSK